MELKRIVAQDLRTATQEAVRLYGPTTLVVSSERINGKMEVIAAVDIKAEPEIEKFNDKLSSKKVVRPNSLSEEIAGESFENILSESLEKKRASKVSNSDNPISKEDSMEKDKEPIDSISGQTLREREHDSVRATLEPKFNMKDYNHNIKPIKSRQVDSETLQESKSEIPSKLADKISLNDDLNKIDNESLRAREIVDLVLREFSDMKKEFKLAQKVALFNSSSQVPIEIKGVVDALNEANIPVGIRTLMIECIADCSSVEEALGALKSQLKNSINTKTKLVDNNPISGIHVFSGPTGSGKTSMLMKIIASATQRGVSEENIAVISYKDTRLGAWSQTQMSCAQVGVEAFKVKDITFLKTLCDELGGKNLILIDTAGVGRDKNLEEIKSAIESVDFHLVLASDSSSSTFESLAKAKNFKWKSLFVSKFDESVSPWGLMQSIINFNTPVSSIWGTGPSSFDFAEFDHEKLVEKALKSLLIADDNELFMNDESNKMVFDTFKGFNTEGVQ